MAVKKQVKQHWETETAGIRYGEGVDIETFYRTVEEQRYHLEPYIPGFAQFERYTAEHVLEIGVGGGVDFSQFVHHGALATGVDLTSAGIAHTGQRLKALNREADAYHLVQADAENLPFREDTFRLVYSWGVMHHSPDTERAFAEAFRVLRPGCGLKAMIYHTPSWTGWMLWIRHALLKGRPFISPKRCVSEYLESPGTKVYTLDEAARMMEDVGFKNVDLTTKLGPGDLLTIKASRRYQGPAYRAVWALFPRWLVRLMGDRFGLFLLVKADNPS